MACLLFHFKIFCSMSCAEEVTQMDHKPTILVIKESLYLYVALFNVCGIPQTYLFFSSEQDGQIENSVFLPVLLIYY